MGELGGTVTYLYWSTRRTNRFLEDNNIEIPAVTQTSGMSVGSWLPTFSRTTTRKGNGRAKVASIIEASLGQSAVTKFSSPSPIRYARGIGSLTFGEFVTWLVNTDDRKPSAIYTTCDYDSDDRDSVAVCLFGSMDNFSEYIQKTGPGFEAGWVSSSAPFVFEFLKSQGARVHEDFTEGEIAVEALKIANGQGLSPQYSHDYHAIGNDRPWQRAFTYGDIQDVAEWLAVIYLDVDLTKIPETGYDRQDGIRRVLIGAPFWIRTPEPHAIRLYGEHRAEELGMDNVLRRTTLRPRRKNF